MPVIVAIALAFLATVLLGILAVGLLRNLRALAAAIGRFQEDVGSTAAKIADDGARAAARLEEIRARFDRGPGARIRR
jgi:hypothetical protein